ncbi:MAG: EAL domain-containing protein, partial [Gemmatimonadaceae bacterium]
ALAQLKRNCIVGFTKAHRHLMSNTITNSLSLAAEEGAIRVLLVENDNEAAHRAELVLIAGWGSRLALQRTTSLVESIRVLMEAAFDVALVELDLDDASGLATLAGIRGAAPTMPVVVYARSLDESLAVRALRAGAQECLAKDNTAPNTLPRLLRFAVERQRHLAALEAARIAAAHRATHDPLTKLANRALFLDHLERALAFGSRYARKTGILFVDLDGFKGINDTLGHAKGDQLLQLVAERLQGCVRRSDSVARLGGDEFVVLLPDVTSRRDVSHVRDTILSCLAEPVVIDGLSANGIEASVGGAMSPLDGANAQELLDAADAAMYREKYARRRGRMPTPVHGVASVLGVAAAAAEVSVPHRRESRMRAAVVGHEFEVHFQPMIDVVGSKIVGAEALLRWRDPERGLILPASFLPLAEDTGLIVPIGEFVLRVACSAVMRWRRTPEGAKLRVSVNLSAVQLREREFERRVAEILHETGCPAEALILELTESSAMVDGDVAIETLKALKSLGLHLVVDDFGVGFASLTFLREAPVDGLKIDRRFVTNMLADARDAAIVGALVRLARGLGLRVVAEGVESAEQSQRLQRLQCFEQQGRHFSDALSAPQFEVLLAASPAVASVDSRLRNPTLSAGVHFA